MKVRNYYPVFTLTFTKTFHEIIESTKVLPTSVTMSAINIKYFHGKKVYFDLYFHTHKKTTLNFTTVT